MTTEHGGTWRSANEWETHCATEHEGHRVFARGQSRWQTILIVTLALAAPMATAVLAEPWFLGVVLRVVVVPWALVMLWVLIAGRARIRITTHEVHIRWRGKHVIPRASIARVVHVRKRTFGMRRTGYIALLGHDGQPLWESPGHIWSQATIEALMRTGEDVISVGRLTRQEARAYFPQLFRFDVGGWIKRVLLGLLVLVVAFVVIILIVSVVVFYS